MISSRFLDPAITLTRTDADDVEFVLSENGTRTWGEYAIAVNNWKKAFAAAGVSSAALFFTDLFDLSSCLFGAWAAGVRAILPADTTQAVCRQLNTLAEAAAGDFPNDLTIRRIKPFCEAEPCRDALDSSGSLVSLFTSGSTGEPALITKRLRQLFCEVPAIEVRRPDAKDIELPQDTVIFSTVPPQHIYGLLFSILWPAASLRPIWHQRILYPEELVARMARTQHCLWIASPAHLKRLPEDLDWACLKNILRVIYTSGGPLSDDALRRTIALTGLSPIEIFGSSESGGIAWRTRALAQDGSIINEAFRALPGIEWKMENSLLVIKSEQLSSNGWESTSDRIAVNSDGSFTLLGRADRIVKIEEKRISLTAVEKALLGTELIANCRAFVRPGSGKLAVAAVPTHLAIETIRRKGKAALARQLREALLRVIERICLPRHWRFVWELPENSLGKLTTQALEALFDPRAVQAVVAERSEQSAELLVTVPGNSPFFTGHFPEFKLLPGVVQVSWAESLARRLFDIDGCLKEIKNLKFMRPISPESTLVLRLCCAPKGIFFAYEDISGETFAKGTLIFAGALK